MGEASGLAGGVGGRRLAPDFSPQDDPGEVDMSDDIGAGDDVFASPRGDGETAGISGVGASAREGPGGASLSDLTASLVAAREKFLPGKGWRGLQLETALDVAKGKQNVFAVMPTGCGKTLTWVLPALIGLQVIFLYLFGCVGLIELSAWP